MYSVKSRDKKVSIPILQSVQFIIFTGYTTRACGKIGIYCSDSDKVDHVIKERYDSLSLDQYHQFICRIVDHVIYLEFNYFASFMKLKMTASTVFVGMM